MTQLLNLETQDGIARLTLDDGRGNALSAEMLEALEKALETAAREAAVLVLRGREKVFCGGLDLPSVTKLDHRRLLGFLELFDRVHERLLAHPTPIVTAARGSAIAGGAILLCAGDHRLVTPHGRVGITEAELGLNLPTSALELVRQALGDTALAEAAQTARVYEGEERRRVGFATEIVAPEAIDDRALELAGRYTKRSRTATAVLRAQLREPALARVRANAARDRARFLDLWFEPRTHAGLVAIAERLAARP